MLHYTHGVVLDHPWDGALSQLVLSHGIGHTEYTRNSGRTPLAQAVEAARGAIADAGMQGEDIDGVACFASGDSAPAMAAVYVTAALMVVAVVIFALPAFECSTDKVWLPWGCMLYLYRG